MVDPRSAYAIDGSRFRLAVPRLSPADLYTLRREFATYLSTRYSRAKHDTWEAAWNDWTGAAPHRVGQVQFTTARCSECKGRRFSHRNVARNLSRTGNPSVCFECRGTGKGTRVSLPATHMPAPPTDAAVSQDADLRPNEAVRDV